MAEILEAWMQALESYDSVVADVLGEKDIGIGNEEFELEHERFQRAKALAKEFVPCAKGQALIAKEMKNSTVHSNTLWLSELLKNTLIDIPQMGYDTAQKAVKNLFFYLTGEVIADIIQLVRMIRCK